MGNVYTRNDRGELVPVSKTAYKQSFKNTFITTKYMLRYVFKKKAAWKYAFLKLVLALLGVLQTIVFTVFPGLIISELTERKRV